MPLSLVLLAIVSSGAAAGLLLPVAASRLLAFLALALAIAAGRARAAGLGLTAALLIAAAGATGMTWRTTIALHDAERPSLVTWFEAKGGADGVPIGRDTPVLLRGQLLRDAAPTPAGALLQVDAAAVRAGDGWRSASGGVALTVAGTQLEGLDAWRAGRTVVLPVSLRRPSRYLNAGVPDQVIASARRGTPLAGTVKSGALIEVIERGGWWNEAAAGVRATVRRALARHVQPLAPASAAVAAAILIGDRAQLSHEVEERLQHAGTYHVVAISGGNIALLAGAVLAACWTVGVRFAPAAAITIVVLLAHSWVVGGGASVVRATLMAGIYLTLRLVDQRTAPMHAAAVAASGMLVMRPVEITAAGFWLTFGATAALLMAQRRWPMVGWPVWLRVIVAIPLATIAVELVLMPVGAFVFQRVTLAGLVLNLGAIPAMGLVQGAASACVVLDVLGLSQAAATAGRFTHVAAQALLQSSDLVTCVPWATWRVPSPAGWLLGLYYTLLVVAWWSGVRPAGSRFERSIRRPAEAVTLLLWLCIATAPWTMVAPTQGSVARLTAIDVGQGDAFLLTAPNGQSVMIDAGGLAGGSSFDVGDRVVAPVLLARGARRLDYLAVTHADIDHLGGAASLVRDFAPREIWGGVPVAGLAPLQALRDRARASRAPWRWLQQGDRLELGGVDLLVHHPPLSDWEQQRVRNDDSIVIEVRYGDVSMWLTGDISRAVEAGLLDRVRPGRIVILKVPHHGSLTSSSAAWLDQLRPAVAVVSAGRGNTFGHPAPAVLERYRAAGAEIFRTDRDGQIELTTNGHAVEVSTFNGRRWRLR